MKANKIFGFFIFLIFSYSNLFAETPPNYIMTGQGIASPSTLATVNLSKQSYFHSLPENPVGLTYRRGMKVSASYATNNDSDNMYSYFGGEFGYSDGQIGFGVGYANCEADNPSTTCDGKIAGALAYDMGSLSLGVHAAEDLYTFGLMFSPRGSHRLGLMFQYDDDYDNDDLKLKYGAGYAFVDAMFTFAFDASFTLYNDLNNETQTILHLSPAFTLRYSMFEFSVAYNTHLIDDEDFLTTAQLDKDYISWGVGVGDPSAWHLAVYGDHFLELAATLSFFF